MENNNKELTISVNNALNAYRNTDENGRELLEHLFGKEVFELKDVKERIKTFEDAMNELGAENPLVTLYESYMKDLPEKDNADVDVTAYLKLRIIAAALNEGWKPKFDGEERRWYPYFYIYTKDEYDRLDEDDKKDCRVVGRAHFNAYVGGGVVFASASHAWSSSYTYHGSRLANRQLDKQGIEKPDSLENIAPTAYLHGLGDSWGRETRASSNSGQWPES